MTAWHTLRLTTICGVIIAEAFLPNSHMIVLLAVSTTLCLLFTQRQIALHENVARIEGKQIGIDCTIAALTRPAVRRQAELLAQSPGRPPAGE